MDDQPDVIGSKPKDENVKTPVSVLIKAITTQLETHSLDDFIPWLKETLTTDELANLVQYFIVMNRSKTGLRSSPSIDPRK